MWIESQWEDRKDDSERVEWKKKIILKRCCEQPKRLHFVGLSHLTILELLSIVLSREVEFLIYSLAVLCELCGHYMQPAHCICTMMAMCSCHRAISVKFTKKIPHKNVRQCTLHTQIKLKCTKIPFNTIQISKCIRVFESRKCMRFEIQNSNSNGMETKWNYRKGTCFLE